jgi:hypothetical protein
MATIVILRMSEALGKRRDSADVEINKLGRGSRRTGSDLIGNLSFKVLDIQPPTTAIFYGAGLVLSRPDQHVAWRGDRLPADPLALIDRVRGAAN